MGTKNHRQGGKFGGAHTTFSDLAIFLVDHAEKCEEVTCISAGFIRAGQGGGSRGVKILDTRGGLLLRVRQSSSVQEVRIISTNPNATKLSLARYARDNDIRISFGRVETAETNERVS